jgi:hypothetical protein
MRDIARGLLVGAALGLLTLLVMTRVSFADPYGVWLPANSWMSDLAAGGQLAGALLALAYSARVITRRFVVTLCFVLVACAAAVALSMDASEPKDVLRIYVGWHAAVPVLVLSVLVAMSTPRGGTPHVDALRLCQISAFSLLLGFVLYFAFPLGNPHLLLAKVFLIVVVPGAGLLAVAQYYRGRIELPVRLAASGCTLVAVLAASVR